MNPALSNPKKFLSSRKSGVNILYHHRTQGTGAAGHHVNEMVKALKALGHGVDVLSPFGLNRQPKTAGGSQKKSRYLIPQFFFEIIALCYNVVAFIKLIKQLRRKEYSLIYERYAIFNMAGVLAARLFNVPIVLEVSFHSNTFVYPKRTRFFLFLANMMDKFIFNSADAIVTVSSVLKTGLVNDFKVVGTKIIVLPNAVDVELFNPIVSGAQIRDKYNLDSNKVIGFAGGFYPWHGLELLVEAAEEVIKVIPGIKFMLIGDGPMKDSLKSKVGGLKMEGSFIFTGSIPHNELPQYISCFDVGVMPDSNDYGSPMKIFEYMAMEKPTLAPKLGPIEEVVEDTVNGLLFTPKDKQRLSDAIISLLSDEKLYRQISQNSRKSVLAEHTWVKNADKIIAFMTTKQIIGRKTK